MTFIDTSVFLSIENRRDTYHTKALSFRDTCLKTGEILVTSDYVLDESYTIIRLRAGHSIAVQFGETLRASRLIRIEYVTPKIIEKAWRLFKSFSDHDFSFTDCTSFLLIERLGINSAFAFDVHFHEYGRFIVKP